MELGTSCENVLNFVARKFVHEVTLQYKVMRFHRVQTSQCMIYICNTSSAQLRTIQSYCIRRCRQYGIHSQCFMLLSLVLLWSLTKTLKHLYLTHHTYTSCKVITTATTFITIFKLIRAALISIVIVVSWLHTYNWHLHYGLPNRISSIYAVQTHTNSHSVILLGIICRSIKFC